MRVLILLALAGVSFAEILSGAVPLPYSSFIVDSPKPSYEYANSVQTPNYQTYSHVRSAGELERTLVNVPAPIVAPAPELLRTIPVYRNDLLSSAVEIKPELTPEIIAARSLLPFQWAAPSAALSLPFGTTKLTRVLSPKFEIREPLVAPLEAGPIVGFRSAQPLAFRTAEPLAFRTAEPLAFRTAEPIAFQPTIALRTGEPAIVPAAVTAEATPAQIVDTVVEPKIVGEGLLARKSQYHTQNELGEATYGHREPFQTHDAIQDSEGNKAGSFSYVAPDGRLLTTDYIADQAGYRVASNALPVAEGAAPVVAEPIVEAKSRSRRSVGIIAPPVSVVKTISTVPIAPRVLISNTLPLSYSYWPYSSIGSPIVRSLPWTGYPGYSRFIALRK